jgi:hypothetical protein
MPSLLQQVRLPSLSLSFVSSERVFRPVPNAYSKFFAPVQADRVTQIGEVERTGDDFKQLHQALLYGSTHQLYAGVAP